MHRQQGQGGDHRVASPRNAEPGERRQQQGERGPIGRGNRAAAARHIEKEILKSQRDEPIEQRNRKVARDMPCGKNLALEVLRILIHREAHVLINDQ